MGRVLLNIFWWIAVFIGAGAGSYGDVSYSFGPNSVENMIAARDFYENTPNAREPFLDQDHNIIVTVTDPTIETPFLLMVAGIIFTIQIVRTVIGLLVAIPTAGVSIIFIFIF